MITYMSREWLRAVLGTDKWVVSARLTPRLRDKGYTRAVSQQLFRRLEQGFAEQQRIGVGPWRPASGHRSGTGRNLWRIVRAHGLRTEEHVNARGIPVLYASYEKALAAAIDLNCGSIGNEKDRS